MLSVYCRCGAAWHGKFAENNHNIVLHANGQGRNRACHLVDHATYLKLHPTKRCYCDRCKDERRQKWHARRRPQVSA